MQSLGKTAWNFLIKLKVESPYDPAILLLDIQSVKKENVNLTRHMCPSTHSSTIYNCQGIEGMRLRGTKYYIQNR